MMWFVAASLRGLLLVVAVWAAAVPAAAQLRLPALFSDGMVLQRDAEVAVWGSAAPGQRLAVTFRHRTAKTTVGEDGAWRVVIGPFAAGGPDVLAVRAGEDALDVGDVLVGEVWVCSGQSNMEWALHTARDAEAEVAAARHPRLRLFEVPRRTASAATTDIDARWQECRPETAREFSAVGYFFGRELLAELDVPIGLIQSAWGGTPAEAWTSPEALAQLPEMEPTLAQWAARDRDYDAALARWRDASAAAKEAGARPPARPRGPDDPHHPSALYHGMVTPLLDYAMRGVIWYQGESNARRAFQYRSLFPAMIRDWRRAFGRGDFPFYFVQLANFRVREPLTWAELREAQAEALSEPNVGMAVSIDIGDADDIHPRFKQEFGARLARCALAGTYGRDVVASGPVYSGHEIGDGTVRVRFDHAEGLRARDDAAVGGFELASAEGEFHPAEAVIDGSTVVLRCAAVPDPAHVRYAYTDDPATANLANGAGLPAAPFRTDQRDWTTRTAHH